MRSQQQISHSQKITELRNETYNSIQYEKEMEIFSKKNSWQNIRYE